MFAFIVLHYYGYNKLIKCLDKLSLYKMPIIIVDNHTLTVSENEQLKKYTEDIIILDNNYGFAKSMNIGIKFAKEKYNPLFYVTSHNDVYIEDTDFINKVNITYNTYKFDILGPYINSETKTSYNPHPVIIGSNNIVEEIMKCNQMVNAYSNIYNYIMYKANNILKKKEEDIDKSGQKVEVNVALDDAFLVFSKKYVDTFIDVFNEKAFTYYNEEFIYKRLVRNKLTSVYNPVIKVYHEDKVLDELSVQKKLELEKEKIKTLELLLKD